MRKSMSPHDLPQTKLAKRAWDQMRLEYPVVYSVLARTAEPAFVWREVAGRVFSKLRAKTQSRGLVQDKSVYVPPRKQKP